MKPSRFYRLTPSSWRRLALAPAALFVVGILHAQTPTKTATVKLPEPVTLLSFDEGTGTYAADSIGDHPATLMGQAGWTTGLVGPYALALPGVAGAGTIYLKAVNAADKLQKAHIVLDGITNVSPQAKVTVLTSASPQDTNTLTDPRKVVPVTSTATVSGNFEFSFAPNSFTVVEIETK